MDEAGKGQLITTIDVSGRMFLLVLAHLGCPGQNPESRKTTVCMCVLLEIGLGTQRRNFGYNQSFIFKCMLPFLSHGALQKKGSDENRQNEV